MHRMLGAGLIGMALAMPLHAADPAGGRGHPDGARALVDERDAPLVFDYLREAVRAGLEGREPPPVPGALVERAQAIGQEIQRSGAAAARALLDAIELGLDEGLQAEPSRLPPTSPLQRT